MVHTHICITFYFTLRCRIRNRMTLVIDRNSFFDLGKCYIRKFISVARINECQTVLVSVLFSFSPSYVDQTTLAGPHLGSCSYLATSDTHIFAPLLLRALRCQTQDFSQRRPFLFFFFISRIFFSHDVKWAKTNDMSAASVRITITQVPWNFYGAGMPYLSCFA